MQTDTLLTLLRLPSPVEAAVRTKLSSQDTAVIAATAYDQDFPLCRRHSLTRLAVVIYLLAEKYEVYRSLGVPEDIIADTFRDVTLRATEFWVSHQKAGLTKDDVIWFRHIMNVHIFKLGSLQFQVFHMVYLDEELLGEPYMVFFDAQKKRLPTGTDVINCHIPQGADLRSEEVGRSFARAREFFQAVFPERNFRAFLCYSWLLYPPMTALLPESSNIRSFARRFTIIGTCQDPDQARENLSGNPTTLQKIAEDHPDKLGFACGIQAVNAAPHN